LLSGRLVDQVREIAAAVRRGEVAPLVGAGLSIPRGLPSWPALVDRLILAWRQWDRSVAARRLSEDNYVRFVRRNFQGDLAVVSYLRQRIQAIEDLSFGQLLYSALYFPFGEPFNPEPSSIHRHLVQLFAAHPARLWTLNYDDLLEEAARSRGLRVATRDPSRRRVGRGLSVAHLHGFLAPPDRAAGHPEPHEAETILTMAEDDFHAVTRDIVGWTNREFNSLFDERRVFMLGMSLDDPNVRRVLVAKPSQPADDAPKHFALLRALKVGAGDLPRTGSGTRDLCAEDANAWRAWYWRQYGVEIVELPDHDTILPLLLRLRYESEGDRPGALWERGAALGYAAIRPWEAEQQQVAPLLIARAIDGLRSDFGVPDGEIVELGLFLARPDEATLELVFRGGRDKVAEPDRVLFSIDPDRPTELAGRVFVSGDVVRVDRDDPLHDYGLERGARPRSGAYAGIISVPLVDWEAGGIPLGVVYVTTATTDGRLFQLPPRGLTNAAEQTLDDLYEWLHLSAIGILGVLRKMGRSG
jgi:hypothetical protein